MPLDIYSDLLDSQSEVDKNLLVLDIDETLLHACKQPLDRVLVVDDSPEKHIRNYGNLICVQPFEGDPSDRELCKLLRYLEYLRDRSDDRKIEKRGWRSSSAVTPISIQWRK